MKSIFESCMLAIGFTFIGWVIIAAGIRFEVKWKGEVYGFTVGGPSEEEIESRVIVKQFNSVLEPQNTFIFIDTNSLLEMEDNVWISHIKNLWPMYPKPIIDKHRKFQMIFFEGRNLLPVDYKFRKNNVALKSSTIYYPIQTKEPLKESVTVQRMIDECNTGFQVDELLKKLQNPQITIIH